MAPYGLPRQPANANEPPLNWRRGLFRVWLLLSVAWIMAWVVYLSLYGIRVGFRELGDFLALPILLFGPPVALLLFGAMAGWAFRGFVPDKER
jgi:hypothetical protein